MKAPKRVSWRDLQKEGPLRGHLPNFLTPFQPHCDRLEALYNKPEVSVNIITLGGTTESV